MTKIPELYASMCFNEQVMKERLPEDVYKSLKRTMEQGKSIDKEIANTVANAMKDWAIEKGATHFTHWFQPMTGVTAEKHDSFISPKGDGNIIMEFSGKELIKGEPDASSFPSGGLRATFEARGYTAWDPTSYAFIKDDSLCIPTAFCSYTGEALDKKTPLLRSMETINKEAQRILKLFGKVEKRVLPTVGAEQEYFLIDKKYFDLRKDLIYAGRTLFGTKPPKGQEMDDHYYGIIKPRVSEYMKELDLELWKLGILANTKHNEAAPAQHELAPIFTTSNISTDQSQLTMEVMKKIAEKHDLVCLLHEKPFAGVNGSGKHNNWALSTSSGVNLLEPGDSPQDNAQFLLFLAAVVKAVDEYQDLLRISIASAGNDHRLGANEAPPAIVSMFLGEELTEILEAIISGEEYKEKENAQMEIGVHVLPKFPKDTTDRNRTSPFAFTGNKFEFRMLGSSESIACANYILNTIVAEELCQFADILEKADDFKKELDRLIKKTFKNHKRIIFNGNNYSDEWVEEAEKRGLLNYRKTPDALVHFADKKNIDLFVKHGIFNENEIVSRQEILLESYAKVINIEALTMVDMVNKDILPAVAAFSKELAELILTKKKISQKIISSYEEETLNKLSILSKELYERINDLSQSIEELKKIEDIEKKAFFSSQVLIPKMEKIRETADSMEDKTSKEYWPFPTYGELLFGV